MSQRTCEVCGQPVLIGDWPFCPHGPTTEHLSSIHSSERAVKFYHPEHGWRTPGRSDEPMPERYREAGFETVEFSSYQSLAAHAKQTGSRSAVLDYDSGSGNERKRYGSVREVSDG